MNQYGKCDYPTYNSEGICDGCGYSPCRWIYKAPKEHNHNFEVTPKLKSDDYELKCILCGHIAIKKEEKLYMGSVH